MACGRSAVRDRYSPLLGIWWYSVYMLKEKYEVRDFLPLIGVFCVVGAVSAVGIVWLDASFVRGMQVVMGVFFLVFGFLKVVRLRSFADAYRMYDLLAVRSVVYAYFYPFIELFLGVLYLVGTGGNLVYWVTVVIMAVSAVGVYAKLRKREKIMCACLGTVFNVPMTWVTLFEDLLMLAMAGYMIVV